MTGPIHGLDQFISTGVGPSNVACSDLNWIIYFQFAKQTRLDRCLAFLEQLCSPACRLPKLHLHPNKITSMVDRICIIISLHENYPRLKFEE